jgi:hypothetical protein
LTECKPITSEDGKAGVVTTKRGRLATRAAEGGIKGDEVWNFRNIELAERLAGGGFYLKRVYRMKNKLQFLVFLCGKSLLLHPCNFRIASG